jgi:hypothetical protein
MDEALTLEEIDTALAYALTRPALARNDAFVDALLDKRLAVAGEA